MLNAPIYEIDMEKFWQDPYPDMAVMRKKYPIAFVPQLNGLVFTRRDDIFVNEKKLDIFSSVQPKGLMQQLMGQNMMRKDGKDHALERRTAFPTISPKTVKEVWLQKFKATTDELIAEILPLGKADVVKDIAMRISGEALKSITGLTQITWQEMDRISQGMIDGCANYLGDPEVEKRCNECTASIDRYIDEMMPIYEEMPDYSLLSVQMQAV